MPRDTSNAPALWRWRHSMGRVWFTAAIAMVLLGGFVVIYGLATGAIELLAPGLGLLVGGALLAVGFRRRARR